MDIEKLATVFRDATDPILIEDLNGVVLELNDEAVASYGFSRDELIGKPIKTIVPEDCHGQADDLLDRCRRGEMVRNVAGFRANKNGDRIPVLLSLSLLRDDNRQPSAIATFAKDISELREAEEKARHLMRVFRDATDPIVIEDLNGNIIEVNQAAEKLYGFSRDELIGQSIKTIVPPSRHWQAEELLESCRIGREIRNVEGLRQTKDGTILPVLITLSLLSDESGTPLGVASFAKEITAQKQAEAELKELAAQLQAHRDDLERQVAERTKDLQEASRQAEAANRAKSEFLSHMSHELRTPLNGILGYAQILQRDPDATENQRRSLQAIINCGDHLLALINDVLDLAKIEAGRLEVDQQPCDIHAILQAVGDIIRSKATAKALEFRIDVSPEVPRVILTDAAKLRQILINLLGNAVKFTQTGSITLAVRESPRGTLQLEIVDTGVGIEKEDLEHIFDAFKQVEAGKIAGGTGLGLSITRQLIHALDGSIDVTSQPGQGSRFTVRIPLLEASEEDLKALVEDDSLHGEQLKLPADFTCTILVADDRDTNRDVLESMLQQAGFQVVMAVDGQDAVDKLRAHQDTIQLVLMDVRMPRMNGIEALQAIRADDSLKSTKVVAVTASVFPDFKKKAMDTGFDDFLAKPFRADDLLHKLAKHLNLEYEQPAGAATVTGMSTATIDPHPSNTLDAEHVERLRNALRIKNLTAIKAIAEELLADKTTQRLGEQVRDSATAFDFRGLATLLDDMETTGD